MLNIIVFQVKGRDSFSILTKAIRVPAGRRAGLDIFATDLSTFLLHLQYQAITKIHLLSKNYHPFLLRSAFSPPTFQMTTSHVAFLSSPLLHGSRQGKSQIIELSSWLQEETWSAFFFPPCFIRFIPPFLLFKEQGKGTADLLPLAD